MADIAALLAGLLNGGMQGYQWSQQQKDKQRQLGFQIEDRKIASDERAKHDADEEALQRGNYDALQAITGHQNRGVEGDAQGAEKMTGGDTADLTPAGMGSAGKIIGQAIRKTAAPLPLPYARGSNYAPMLATADRMDTNATNDRRYRASEIRADNAATRDREQFAAAEADRVAAGKDRDRRFTLDSKRVGLEGSRIGLDNQTVARGLRADNIKRAVSVGMGGDPRNAYTASLDTAKQLGLNPNDPAVQAEVRAGLADANTNRDRFEYQYSGSMGMKPPPRWGNDDGSGGPPPLPAMPRGNGDFGSFIDRVGGKPTAKPQVQAQAEPASNEEVADAQGGIAAARKQNPNLTRAVIEQELVTQGYSAVDRARILKGF